MVSFGKFGEMRWEWAEKGKGAREFHIVMIVALKLKSKQTYYAWLTFCE